MSNETHTLSGRCFCGALTWTSTGSMLWTAICHCADCRRIASSDYVSWFGVDQATLMWSGPRHFFKSSDVATRSFCGICGTPTSFEATTYPGQTCLYAATLDDGDLYRPSMHLFWPNRRPWVQFEDDLPKYPRSLHEAQMTASAAASD